MNILLVLHCVKGYRGEGRRAAAGLRIGSHCYSTAPITKSTKSTRTAHALVSEPDPSTIVQVLELLSGPPKYIYIIFEHESRHASNHQNAEKLFVQKQSEPI